MLARLAPPTGKVERAIRFTLAAWDANCPQHIPREVSAETLAAAAARIAELEAENAVLRAALGAPSSAAPR